jgi:hypothetical protein
MLVVRAVGRARCDSSARMMKRNHRSASQRIMSACLSPRPVHTNVLVKQATGRLSPLCWYFDFDLPSGDTARTHEPALRSF